MEIQTYDLSNGFAISMIVVVVMVVSHQAASKVFRAPIVSRALWRARSVARERAFSLHPCHHPLSVERLALLTQYHECTL